MSVIINRLDNKKNYALAVSIAFVFLFLFKSVPIFCEYTKAAVAGQASGVLGSSEVNDGTSSNWKSFESKYFTVYYRPDANLYGVERRLKKRAYYFGKETLSGDASVEDKIGYRLDYLFRRACETLDMFPGSGKIKVKIMEDGSELEDEYFKIFGTREEMKAFYVHRFGTIYTSEEDISDSVIVHEISHAIIDNYFAVVPPKKISEIMATYVDTHLDD